MRENLLELAAGRIDSETLLVLDPTDISKPYAQKMQYLAPVRDGSEGRLLVRPSDRGEAVRRSRKSLWRVVEIYLTRWRVEETIRFVKQSYQLEDIRLLSYERLRSMATLVMAAAYFACVHLGETVKLTILLQHIYKAAKRIYGVPEFRFYAIADGIKKVFFGRQAGIGRPPPASASSGILLLPLSL